MGISQCVDRWTVLNKLWELSRNERGSRARLEKIKLRKFRRLVAYSYRNSPYYRVLIEKNRINIRQCVPSDFPVLDKKQLMENFDRIVTDSRITKTGVNNFLSISKNPRDLFLEKYHVVVSSGSSGTASYCLYNRKGWLHGLTQGLRVNPLQTPFQQRKYAYIGSLKSHCAGASAVLAGIHADARYNDIRAYEVDAPIMSTVVELNAFKPDGIGGYTSAIKMLAEKKNQGVLHIKPKWIEAMGEALLDTDKAYLKKTFGCDVYSLYGSTEHLLMGIGGGKNLGMILYDDDLIYEFYDDHIITTNLFNFVVPLIRYRSSDILRPRLDSQSLLPYIESAPVVGRLELSASFINKNRDEDSLTIFNLDGEPFFIRSYQLQPIDETSFNFRVSFHEPASANENQMAYDMVEAWLEKILREKEMENVRFTIQVVDDIPINPRTGKYERILPRLAKSH